VGFLFAPKAENSFSGFGGKKKRCSDAGGTKGFCFWASPLLGSAKLIPQKKTCFQALGQKENLFRRRRNKGVLLLGCYPSGISEANPSRKNLFSGFGAKRKPVPTQEEQRGFAFGLLPIRDQRS
jgi:hypothetical protein